MGWKVTDKVSEVLSSIKEAKGWSIVGGLTIVDNSTTEVNIRNDESQKELNYSQENGEELVSLEENEVIQSKISRLNAVLIRDPDTGDTIVKRGDALTEEDWSVITESFGEHSKENNVWMTTPEIAPDQTDFYEASKEFQTDPIIKYSKGDYSAPLSLCKQIRQLLEDRKYDKSKEKTAELENEFPRLGKRILNLYLSGYLDGVESSVEVDLGDETADKEKKHREVNEFIQETIEDSIYFVSSESERNEQIISKIEDDLEDENDKVVIRGLGEDASTQVFEIFEQVQDLAQEQGYSSDMDPGKRFGLNELVVEFSK